MPLYIPKNIKYSYTINNQTIYIRVQILTKRWIKGFEAAKKASFLTDSKVQSHRMGSAIFQGSTLLSIGHNAYNKSKPGNSFIHNGKQHDKSLHSEQMAVDKIRHYEYTSKLIMYVVRLNSLGEYVASAPCDMCIEYMRKYNIKVVRFINVKGQPEELVL